MPGFDVRQGSEPEGEAMSVSVDGVLSEQVRLGDDTVIVHYDDIPPGDITTIRGIPCTTALRTVIDLAPELAPAELSSMVEECLGRRLFTLDEAWERLAQPDMAQRSGAEILRRHLR